MTSQALHGTPAPSEASLWATSAQRGGVESIPDAHSETYTVTDEQLLISQVRNGDTRAFEALYRLHVNRIYAHCLRMTGNKAEAEDRTQEVFIRAWEKIASFEGNSTFYTWLHRIAVNLLISAHRKGSTRTRHEEAMDDPVEVGRGRTQDQTAQRLDLETAMARLPERARMAFVLHDVEGYKHDEISALTGMAAGTSKAQVHRARKLLREILA